MPPLKSPIGRTQALRRLAATALAISVLAACSGPNRIAVSAEPRVAGGLAGGSPLAMSAVAFGRTSAVHRPDLLLVSPGRLRPAMVKAIRDLPGVAATETLALATGDVAGQRVTIAGVDPQTYRLFSPESTAEHYPLWQVVAAGGVALSPEAARHLRKPLGSDIQITGAREVEGLRVGAHAWTVAGVDAVVNRHIAERLGIPSQNALLVSGDGLSPTRLRQLSRRLSDRHVSVRRLSSTAGQTRQHAALVGGPLARALGSFTYKYFPDGTIDPDPRWVSANIRTANVPILGQVTCHRLMLPQLRAALQEVVHWGLTHTIDPDDYGGCYVPRFIGHDPDNGISLHTWGIALDLNVSENMPGTTGRIDPRVVTIFKRWGFAWGGDWDTPDPMHFELAALVRG